MGREATRSMTTLNRAASEVVAGAAGVHAMTDVTGFGLMGHGRELALGSGMTIEFMVERVPRIEGALDAIHLGAIPAGSAGESRVCRVRERGCAWRAYRGRCSRPAVRPANSGWFAHIGCSRELKRAAPVTAQCRRCCNEDRRRARPLHCRLRPASHSFAVKES